MLKFIIAQLNCLVGDMEGNADKVIDKIKQAEKTDADVIIFPELVLTGYPVQDLLLRPRLYERTHAALDRIKKLETPLHIILGYPEQIEYTRYNALSHIYKGRILATYYKRHLPNYSVFDEKRYFTEGKEEIGITYIKHYPIALAICEDIWHPETVHAAANAGAKLMVSINASPFAHDKYHQRLELLKKQARAHHLPILYANLVGGQDEIVFDGGSFVLNKQGNITHQAPFFKETSLYVDLKHPQKTIATPCQLELIYQALTLGVRDYVEKNHFPGVILGLSGGIDSALTLAIAVDALGSDRVEAIMLPSRYTSELSLNMAKKQAQMLGVRYRSIPIESLFSTLLNTLELKSSIAKENLQARARGILLMGLSNETGKMVLSTGNKSEMAVGYSTLYGDMVGGFAVLKDIPKTWVYRLAQYRNGLSDSIPQPIIDRPPTAELASNQKDQDTLPDYEILDKILYRYIELDEGFLDIVAAGFDRKMVSDIIYRVNRNEYKRHQAPVGVKITDKAFGRDRRYPITSGYLNYLKKPLY